MTLVIDPKVALLKGVDPVQFCVFFFLFFFTFLLSYFGSREYVAFGSSTYIPRFLNLAQFVNP